jgi:hypothetical protein
MKKISLAKAFTFVILLVSPLSTFAQGAATVSRGFSDLSDLINTFTNTVIKSTATLFLSLALLAFFYGIVEYIWAKRKGDATGVKNGGQFMTWGLVALFVMFSVYGIIKLAQNVLGLSGTTESIIIPDIQFKSGTSASANAPASPGNVTGTGNSSINSPGNVTSTNNSSGPSSGNTQTSLKSIGESCYISSQCLSNYCNRQGMCAVLTSSGASSIGESCVLNADCSSNYCNRQGMCATPVTTESSGSGLPEGAACGGTDYTPCADGLACSEGKCLLQ